MLPFNPKHNKQDGPEGKIQDAFMIRLRGKEWVVKSTHGNILQYGFPDLYAAHRCYGPRWIEIKNPLNYSFTKAQLDFFPQLMAAGVGVWVVVADTEEEYRKLFKPANWMYYLPSFRNG